MSSFVGSLAAKATNKNDWVMREEKGLKILQSPLLLEQPLKTHAFTTRHAGETPSPFDSFNLGRHDAAKDYWDDALKNRFRLCETLAVPSQRLKVPGQVHSDRVVFLEETDQLREVDAVFTVSPDVPILLHFADCVPIILYERRKNSVCVIHAGWRGTAASIARKAVENLVNKLKADPRHMVAAVGPAIGSCCYPTSDEAAAQLATTISEASLFIERLEQPRPDLGAINAMQLLKAGVEEVDVCNLCTCCHPELFYSHRHSGGITGRQGAIACLR